MKRLIFTLLVFALMATPALAGPTFTFTTQAEVLGFTQIASQTNDGDAVFQYTTTNSSLYGPAMSAHVGIVADEVGEYPGTNPTPGSVQYLGVGNSGFNLTGYDAFSVTIFNDNDDYWEYKLFAFDASNTVVSGSWTTIPKSGGSATLSISLDTDGILGGDLGNNSTLGIRIGRSDHENKIHTSILIPAPGAIILGSIGVGLVGWLRRRKSL